MATKDWPSLRAAADYRGFLRAYLEERDVSLADLARASGFGRGFPGDVISCKRRLTSRSCRAFEQALKLPSNGKLLFRLLVAIEEPDQFPELRSASLQTKIDELRTKPWTRKRRDLVAAASPKMADLLKDPHTLSVYAAMGEPGAGATLEQIQTRTQLSYEQVRVATTALEAAELLTRFGDRCMPADLHLFLKAGNAQRGFLDIYQASCRSAAERARHALDSEREMFFTSAFCVEESKLPELKAALRTLVLRFVDESIAPEGDRVVRLVTGLHL